jgi:hypothetical protein
MHSGAMSATDRSDALARGEEGAGAARANGRVCLFVLLLFIAAAAISAIRKDVTLGFDELAHASYVAHLQSTGEIWPAFKDMRMLDATSFRFTGEANYLNHPSPYYWLLAHLGPTLEGHPEAIVIHRLFNVALAAIGFAAFMAIGLFARLPRLKLYAYIVPLACIPLLVPLGGAINNDNLAFCGGGIAALAAWRLIATGSSAALLAALGGVVIASLAKMTALLLVGGLVGGVIVWLIWRGRFKGGWIAPIVIAALLAGAPYVALTVQYGSPAPGTPGQTAMLKAGAQAAGWDAAARMPPAAYAVHFVGEFVTEWMPALGPRTALNYAALAIPVAAIFCAFAGFVVSMRRIASGDEGPIDVMVVAGALAFSLTFVIHGVFSYPYHLTFGWMTSAYPRYYLPLAFLVPLAGLSLLAAVRHSSARAILTGFLIVGPVIFRLLGAPLG